MKSSKVGLYKGNKFLLTQNFLFVAQALDHISQETTLHVALSSIPNYEFKQIEFSMKERSYNILDTDQNSVFIHVNHSGEKSPYGQIYISDKDGVNFSSSLRYNARVEDSIEFEKVLNLFI